MPISFGDKLIYRDWDLAHRNPAGAVPVGTPLHFFVACEVPEISACAIMLWQSGAPTVREIAMVRTETGFVLEFCAPETPLVSFYRFHAETPAGSLYLGRTQDSFWAGAALTPETLEAFQLTVYAKNFEVPDWFRGGVLYQIFPDRFAPGEAVAVAAGLAYHRAMGRNVQFHPRWDEPVKWREADGEDYNPNDFYGGTLDAITRKLPYLHDLGITALYLNPIFEAASNHRYNTADYRRVDPILGTNQDLETLCAVAATLEIRVILDGVFSHTGADSRYFNAKENYPEAGAWQSRDSRWFSWYDFQHWPEEYRTWWGFPSLPEVREEDSSWQEEIITGPDSIVRLWLRAGASGYRLDVADELPDETLASIRSTARSERPDALILGEVWEDPTTKISYGQRRRYALGESLDSVMNYPLRRRILDFLLWRCDSRALLHLLLGQRLHYPLPLYQSLMNLLSSHDVDRALTVLSTRLEGDGLTREQRAGFFISETQRARGKQAMELATALIWSLPGVPSIYYGEETGMQGFGDPFVREPMDWDTEFLQAHYRQLSQIRRRHPALREGSVAFSAPSPHCLCVLRQDSASKETILAVFARGDTEAVLDLEDLAGDPIPCMGVSRARPLLGRKIPAICEGLLPLSLPAGFWGIYQLEMEE